MVHDGGFERWLMIMVASSYCLSDMSFERWLMMMMASSDRDGWWWWFKREADGSREIERVILGIQVWFGDFSVSTH